jgi:hypothetical protein
MKVSAAVFKNPVHSRRFIGQDWRKFRGSVDILMPMNYRDHYPGSFEVYLDLLAETIGQQKVWSEGFEALWPGFAINFLFFEEERPLAAMAKALEVAEVEDARREYDKISTRLCHADPSLGSELGALFGGHGDLGALRARVGAFRSRPPGSYWPKEKVTRVIERVRSTGVSGLTMFCAGHLEHYGLWDTAKAAFEG